MVQRFLQHLKDLGLTLPTSRVLVGYSGGADSTCLLHLLSEAGVDLVAGHLHHGMRPEADTEMRLCESFCQTLNIPFMGGRADVPRMSRELKMGIEEAGRNARYEFLRTAAIQTGCDLIATAHTRDDLVETVLLNLVRGCGVAGLAGIPVHRDNIIRPLLPFSRAETREHCEAHGFWIHDDPANFDENFSRVRIRNHVVPQLRLINPEFERAVERLAGIAEEESELLDSMAAAALEQCDLPLNGELTFLTSDCEFAFDLNALRHLPPALTKRAIRLVSATLGAELDWHQTHAILAGINGEKGSITAEGGNVVAEWGDQRLMIRTLDKVPPFRIGVTIPGETIREELNWVMTASPEASNRKETRRASCEALIDLDRVNGTLYFRSVKPGDAMQPMGFEGRRKVADLMSEAKLTVNARSRIPVVCDMIGPVWVPGVCLDERVRAFPESQRKLLLRFGPYASGGDLVPKRR